MASTPLQAHHCMSRRHPPAFYKPNHYYGSEIARELGMEPNKFDAWLSGQRKAVAKLCADPAVPDHIKEGAAKRLAKLEPPTVTDPNGQPLRVMTKDQIEKLDALVHPTKEAITVKGEELTMVRDGLPQPRNPATGKKTTWTLEMLQERDWERYLPDGFFEELERRGTRRGE